MGGGFRVKIKMVFPAVYTKPGRGKYKHSHGGEKGKHLSIPVSVFYKYLSVKTRDILAFFRFNTVF